MGAEERKQLSFFYHGLFAGSRGGISSFPSCDGLYHNSVKKKKKSLLRLIQLNWRGELLRVWRFED